MVSVYNDGSPVHELHYITPIANVRSILEEGILSHNRAASVEHEDVSNGEVQWLRDGKFVVNPDRNAKQKSAKTVHDYANVFFTAHNPMLFVLKDKDTDLCVLRIAPEILNRSEVVVSSQNAARSEAMFYAAHTFKFSPESTSMLLDQRGYVHTEDSRKKEKRRGVRSAEVLVPYKIHPSYIKGVYVKDKKTAQKLRALFKEKPPVPLYLYPDLFFERRDRKCKGPLEIKGDNKSYPELDETLPESDSEGETMFHLEE